MESTTPTPQNSVSKFAVPGAVVALIAIAVIGIYASKPKPAAMPAASATPAATTASTPAAKIDAAMAKDYTDGEYTAKGSYLTPGGEREINLSLTIKDNQITASTFEGLATDPASVRFQGEFGDNYKAMIVGKNINEVQLTKVSGSSLTPQGFMDALEKIKTQAQS